MGNYYADYNSFWIQREKAMDMVCCILRNSDLVHTRHCNFMVYRSRGETEQDFYVGARQDQLRRVDGAWKIANRRLILDQNVLTAKNLSIFF